MVVQRTVDNLKQRPDDEKKAVAGGIAVLVVAVLFAGWAFFFFRSVKNGSIQVDLSSGTQQEFNFSSTVEAQKALEAQYGDKTSELMQLRQNAAANQAGQGSAQASEDTADFGGTDTAAN